MNQNAKDGCITFIIIIALFCFIPSMCSKTPEEKQKQEKELTNTTLKVRAIANTKLAVEANLKSPSSAKYPSSIYYPKVEIKNTETIYTFKSYVDSQNSFGAMIRTPFTCIWSYNKEKGWTLLNIYFN